MQDFDRARADRKALGRIREFQLDGQTFTAHLDVRPEVIIDFLAGGTFSIERIDALVEAFLDGDSWERFAELRKREIDPLTFADLGAIAGWLIEEETGRPTSASSDSGVGRATSGTSSTDASQSQDTPAAPTPSLSAVS